MAPNLPPLSERERFALAVLLVPGLPLGWADRVWDNWETDPWSLLEQLRGQGHFVRLVSRAPGATPKIP